MLQNEFIQYVEEAEKKQSLSLISKATAMKGKADEKREEVAKLEKTHIIAKEKVAKIN